MSELFVKSEAQLLAEYREHNLPACSLTEPEVFFPQSETKPNAPDVQEARWWCGHCAIREICLEGALERREAFGIWGGLTSPERNKILRRQNRAKTRPIS